MNNDSTAMPAHNRMVGTLDRHVPRAKVEVSEAADRHQSSEPQDRKGRAGSR